jgi:hypothetical protein
VRRSDVSKAGAEAADATGEDVRDGERWVGGCLAASRRRTKEAVAMSDMDQNEGMETPPDVEEVPDEDGGADDEMPEGTEVPSEPGGGGDQG